MELVRRGGPKHGLKFWLFNIRYRYMFFVQFTYYFVDAGTARTQANDP
jgi:hypothetical protein